MESLDPAYIILDLVLEVSGALEKVEETALEEGRGEEGEL